MEQTKESYRERRGLPFVDTLVQDLRFALRMLAKKPGFALVAILTLAVGVGATSAVFSVVDRILFRSLPYPQDDRLVSFGVMAPFDSREFMLGPDFVDWRVRQGPFETITAVEPVGEDDECLAAVFGTHDFVRCQVNGVVELCSSVAVGALPIFPGSLRSLGIVAGCAGRAHGFQVLV